MPFHHRICRAQRRLHDAAGDTEYDPGPGALPQGGIKGLLLEEFRVDMLRPDHAHKFPCGQYDIHVLPRSGTPHVGQGRLTLLGHTGHDGDTADIVGIDPFLLCKIILSLLYNTF